MLVPEGVLECCTPKQILKIYPGEGYFINTDVLHMNRMAIGSSQVKYRVLAFIHDHCTDAINVDDIANAASISRRETFRCFRQTLNTTPTLYLLQHRINHGARMLVETRKAITEISFDCGFSGSSYFCKAFHDLTGVPPSVFRLEGGMKKRGGLSKIQYDIWLTRPMVSWYNADMDKKTTIPVALAIIAVMNIAAFALMGHDKRCARQGKWRVAEKTLFLVTACFGGLGGVLGMKVFHHKTNGSILTG